MKKLYRSQKDKKLAGICGGIGEALEIDPTLIRLAVVFCCVATAVLPDLITYIVAWIIIPPEPDSTSLQ